MDNQDKKNVLRQLVETARKELEEHTSEISRLKYNIHYLEIMLNELKASDNAGDKLI